MFRRMIPIGIVAALASAPAGVPPARSSDASSGPLLLVANKGDKTLGLIDPVGGRQVATVKESGVTGHEVIASPDGLTAYVPIYGDAGVGKPGSDGRTKSARRWPSAARRTACSRSRWSITSRSRTTCRSK